MDYHDSSAGNARLAVIKYAATAKKLGSLFFNPGHPLCPGSYPRADISILQADLAVRGSTPSYHMVRRLVKYSRARMI